MLARNRRVIFCLLLLTMVGIAFVSIAYSRWQIPSSDISPQALVAINTLREELLKPEECYRFLGPNPIYTNVGEGVRLGNVTVEIMRVAGTSFHFKAISPNGYRLEKTIPIFFDHAKLRCYLDFEQVVAR